MFNFWKKKKKKKKRREGLMYHYPWIDNENEVIPSYPYVTRDDSTKIWVNGEVITPPWEE